MAVVEVAFFTRWYSVDCPKERGIILHCYMHLCSCGGPSVGLCVPPATRTNCISRLLSEIQESAGNNCAGYNNGWAISRSRDFGLAGFRAMLQVPAADSCSVGAEPHLQKPGRDPSRDSLFGR